LKRILVAFLIVTSQKQEKGFFDWDLPLDKPFYASHFTPATLPFGEPDIKDLWYRDQQNR